MKFPHHVPTSNYSILPSEESSIGPLYKMRWEEVEKDEKWKLLSKSYEIIIENVAEFSKSITIYELRSSAYK